MLELFEQQMREDVSTVFHRYANTNNKYVSNYEKYKETSCISYLDAINLYSLAMSKPLPIGNFKFMNRKNIGKAFNEMTRNTYLLEQRVGIVFQADIDYFSSLHDCHNNYPFLPEHRDDNLTPNLYNKHYYVWNEHNFIYALKHGLRLVGIRSALTVYQSPFLKQYIDLNANLGAQSKNPFEKKLFELMNSSVFKKTMENIAKRCNLSILYDSNDYSTIRKLNLFVEKPNYKEILKSNN